VGISWRNKLPESILYYAEGCFAMRLPRRPSGEGLLAMTPCALFFALIAMSFPRNDANVLFFFLDCRVIPLQ